MSVGRLRWTWRSMSSTACWSWDARPTSASPEPRQGWGHCARIPDPCTTAPEVRMARIIDAIGLHQARKLSCVEAAELLGMSERHFRRLRDAYEERGAEGIIARRRGRASG